MGSCLHLHGDANARTTCDERASASWCLWLHLGSSAQTHRVTKGHPSPWARKGNNPSCPQRGQVGAHEMGGEVKENLVPILPYLAKKHGTEGSTIHFLGSIPPKPAQKNTWGVESSWTRLGITPWCHLCHHKSKGTWVRDGLRRPEGHSSSSRSGSNEDYRKKMQYLKDWKCIPIVITLFYVFMHSALE